MSWGKFTLKIVNLATPALKKIKLSNVIKTKPIKKIQQKTVTNLETRPERLLPVNPPKHYGKHKIKRYLYHFTSEENYRKMLESGVINTSSDGAFGILNGVFMTDLENLTKNWMFTKGKNSNYSLACALLAHVAKGHKKIVAIRVPTKYLDHNFLRIRSQNRLFRQKATGKSGNAADIPHEAVGCPAKFVKLFAQRKEAFEYIYGHKIPIDKVEFVGCADIDDFKKLVENADQTAQHELIINVLRLKTPKFTLF